MPVRGDNSLFFSSGIDTSGLAAGAQTAIGIVRGMATSIGAISPFAILATGAIAAFGAIGNHAYDMMKKFESAMAEVKTIANVTEGEFEKLSQDVFNLSKELGTESPDALAKGLYDIIGAGYAATDALKLLATSSKAATAGVTTSAVAADGLTTILNAFGLAASDATEIADQMFQVVNLGKISFDQLASNIAQVAPLAAASGFSFQEIGAAIATLTKQGIPASEAMTQIRSGIISVGEVMGDGVSKTMTLQNAFEVLYQRAGGSQDELKNLVGRVEAMNAVLSIAGPNLKSSTQDLLDMADATGAVNNANEIITSTTANQWEILGNRISTTTKAIGNGFLTVSNGLAKFLNESLENSEDLKKSFDEQRLKLIELERGLKTAVVGSEEYRKIKAQIIEQFPEYLSGIDIETASTADLLKVLDRVNESYRQRYKLALRAKELEKEEQKAGNIELKIENYEIEFKKTLDRLRLIAEDKKIKLNIDYDDSKEEIIKSIENQLKGVEGALDFYYGKGKDRQVKKGFAAEDLSLLRQYSAQVVGLNKELVDQNEKVEESAERSRSSAQKQLKTESGRLVILEKISAAMKESDFADFVGSGIPEIDKAIEKQKEFLAVIDQIKEVSLEEFKEDRSILDSFLFKGIDDAKLSENEKKIKKFAAERQRILNTNFDGNPDPDKQTFTQALEERKKQYEAYFAAIEQLGKESADKIFSNLLASGSSFPEYLKNLLEQTQGEAEKIAISVAAQSAGIDLNREVQTMVSSIESKPIVLGVELDTTSINFLERELEGLRDRLDATQTNSAEGRRLANSLRDEIQAKEEKLQIARDGISEEQKLYENLHLNLSDLRNKGLRDYIEDWNQRLAIAQAAIDKLKQSGQVDTPAGKKLQKEADEAAANIQAARDEIAKNTAETIQKLGAVFGEASDLARKFGDEDLANLLSQLQGVANGVASTMAGILSGNPLDIAKGVLEVLNSAITIEVESDTAKFEAAITKLKAAIADLDYAISRGIGMDKISNRQDAILELKDLQEQADKAIEAEKEAEKRVKLLGITVGKKGKGSGTDHEKIKQIAEEAKEAERRVQELKDELNELFTGTTSSNITDSIIEGFRNGKFAIEDFTQGFEDMMKEAMLNAFQLKYLDDAVKEFYEEFSGAGSDGTFTAAEIENLRAMYATMIEGAQSDIEAINDILNASGIGSIGEQGEGDQREGLSGAITNITEDTANLLAGYMNAMRIDIRQGVTIAVANSQLLGQIVTNTSYLKNMDDTMTSIDGRMGTIERAIRDAQAQG